MSNWLISVGLRFADPDDEALFLQSYCIRDKKYVQIALILGAVLLYVFFIWDSIIDPENYAITHAIRGLFLTPAAILCAALLMIRRLDPWYETILMTTGVATIVGLSVVYYILESGFDHGAVGIVLVVFFVTALVVVRVVAFAVLGIATIISFNTAMLISGNYTEGMVLVNNLSVVSSVLLGTVAVLMREIVARREFKTIGELNDTRAVVSNLEESNRALRDTANQLLGASPTNLFISYRRQDSEAVTGRIRDRLAGQFGEGSVFMDIDDIPFGVDFRSHVGEAIRNADLMLVVIGPDWLAANEQGRNRIDEETDPVRIEIEQAFKTGLHIIPALVGGAQMPAAGTLPESLTQLSYLNGISIDTGRDFHPHMTRLILAIGEVLGAEPAVNG